MIYAGVARNDSEREQALALGAASFSPPNASMNAAMVRKALLLHDHPGYRSDSPIVVCDQESRVVGSLFLIDCILPIGECLLKGVFISTVSVAEDVRGKGFSVLLMEAAIKAAADRGAEIAMLIARRAVDRYYLRFGFWGLSQYSRVTLNVATLPLENQIAQAITLAPVKNEDFPLCADLYTKNYKDLFGHCLRKPEMWGYIVRKLPYLGMRLDLVKVNGRAAGYVVHDAQGNVHELALMSGDVVCNARWFLEACASGLENVTLHIPPTHPFLMQLEGADVSLTLRECHYGGHMLRILSRDLANVFRDGASDSAGEAIPRLGFAETARCLRLARVTDFDSAQGLGMRGSFNIPLLDQI